MKVLGISGSPRRSGNTDLLLNRAIDGAEDSDAEVQKVWLRELEIHHCQGCNACFKAGICRYDDDMTELYELILEADVLILGSPVYFSGLSSMMKQMIDRCQCIWARKVVLKEKVGSPNRIGGFISVGAQTSPVFRNSISVVKSFYNSIDVAYKGELTVGGADAAGAVTSLPGMMMDAYQFGRQLVKVSASGPSP